jgi:hypothetical protein
MFTSVPQDTPFNTNERVAAAAGEIRERHLVPAADLGVHVVNLAGKSVRWKPFGHRVGVEKRPKDLLGRCPQHPVQLDGVRHRRLLSALYLSPSIRSRTTPVRIDTSVAAVQPADVGHAPIGGRPHSRHVVAAPRHVADGSGASDVRWARGSGALQPSTRRRRRRSCRASRKSLQRCWPRSRWVTTSAGSTSAPITAAKR